MTQFLMLTLYAPLASWGDIAVGELRGSWNRPSRSAVFGLIAAGLGLDRTDQLAHDSLDEGYGLAIRLDTPGAPLVDYHTAQTVSQSVGKRVRSITRKAVLEAGARETILSWRTYRSDSLTTAALWAHPGARWPLTVLAEALRCPAFVLYAGRKCNPFALPLNPEVIEVRTLADAFAARPIERVGDDILRWKPKDGWGREVAHDAATDFVTGLHPLRRETRRDTHPQRARWQFAERTVEIGWLPASHERAP